MRYVPNLDFRSLAFAEDLRAVYPSVYGYSGPSHPVSNIAGAAMANGAILPIGPLAGNSSWAITFFGPSIKCDPVNDTMHRSVREDMFMFLTAGRNASLGLNSYTLYGYMGWFPNLGKWASSSANNTFGDSSPFYSSGSSEIRYTTSRLYHTFFMFAASPAMAQTYMTNIGSGSPWDGGLESASLKNLPPWLDGTVVECRLLNSSYDVSFNYTEGLQQIRIQNSPTDPNTPVTLPYSVFGPAFGFNGSAFNSSNVSYKSCLKLSFGVEDAGQCIFDAEVLRTLSYQAVWDAFTAVLTGTVRYYITSQRIVNSSIIDTALTNVRELSILRGVPTDPALFGASLKPALALYDDPRVQGLTSSYDGILNISLTDALEEMFQNVTVSMMSSPALL